MIQVLNNKEFGQLRTTQINNKTYFVGKDVATALGYSNTNDAISRHCKGVVKHEGLKINGTELALISEGDVYRLIIKSKLPAAEQFESWVMDEVLPAIRANGAYVSASITSDQESKLLKYGTPLARRNHLLTTPIENLEAEIKACMDYNKRKTVQEKVTIRKHMTRLIDERKELATSTAQKLWLEEVKLDVIKKMSTTKSKSYANKLFKSKKTVEELSNTIEEAKDYVDKLEAHCEDMYPAQSNFATIDIHPFSVNSMYTIGFNGRVRTKTYNNWINKFPATSWGNLECDKNYAIYLQFECLDSFDVDNLSKSIVDQIVRDTGVDDKNFIFISATKVKEVETYGEGKIHYCIKEIINE